MGIMGHSVREGCFVRMAFCLRSLRPGGGIMSVSRATRRGDCAQFTAASMRDGRAWKMSRRICLVSERPSNRNKTSLYGRRCYGREWIYARSSRHARWQRDDIVSSVVRARATHSARTKRTRCVKKDLFADN